MRSMRLVTLLCATAIGFETTSNLRPAQAGEASPPERIVWFGTWEGAKAEAKRTGRPILLTSAMPACGGVPGMW